MSPRPNREAAARCERCAQGDRRPVKRAKLAERDGKVAVVLDVPMEDCPACGDRWLIWDLPRRLDDILTAMMAGSAEFSARHFTSAEPSPT